MILRLRISRRFASSLALATLVVSACSSNSAPPPSVSAGPRTWQVRAGDSASAEAFQGLAYYPSSTVTIDEGDTVRWVFPSGEPHTVALLPSGATKLPSPADPTNAAPVGGSTFDGSAYVSSGFLAGGATYSLRFTKAGTYAVYCLIHQPEMVANIVVKPAGTRYMQLQGDYNGIAATQSTADLASAQASVASYPYGSGGTHFAAGIAPGGSTAKPSAGTVLRFLSTGDATVSTATVPVGSSVTWTNLSNNEPHTVTFAPVGQPFPKLDPFSPPSGGTTYDGSTLVNSGPLFPGQSVTFTFTKPGTYTYHCIFHDDTEGMVSTLVVN